VSEIERLEAKRQAYDADEVSRGSALVLINHDGAVRIERGFIRPRTTKPQPEAEQPQEALRGGRSGWSR